MMAIDGIGWDLKELLWLERKRSFRESSNCTEEFVPTEFSVDGNSLERDLELKDYKIENLTNELEKVKKERDGISSKLGKFVNSSKDLDQMLESHKSGNDKKGVGFDEYRSVPPPPTQVYSSPMPDLSWSGLLEFVDNTVTDYTRPTPSVEKQMMDLDFEDESDTESTPIESIRCDNGGEFRNKEMDDFCSKKGIKREFSNARTPQQNGVAKRRNRTLIEAARTCWLMLKLLCTFWAEAVNTACYVQNRVLVTKPLNKTPYELFNGRAPTIGFLRPFGCHVMILNTLDHLGKFGF
ncbi:retrovirus-related pol polyprotein from transposon TNT 1-94 [Tanacetum coccineum]